LRQELADELKIYIAPLILGQDGTAALPDQLDAMVKHQNLKNIQTQTFDKDICISGLL
jgi:riboflavin biosynthesis pyrimidine reductase